MFSFRKANYPHVYPLVTQPPWFSRETIKLIDKKNELTNSTENIKQFLSCYYSTLRSSVKTKINEKYHNFLKSTIK
nr:unnamed protein product [Callosobruchus analis]